MQVRVCIAASERRRHLLRAESDIRPSTLGYFLSVDVVKFFSLFFFVTSWNFCRDDMAIMWHAVEGICHALL
jgi:hypothetical protein